MKKQYRIMSFLLAGLFIFTISGCKQKVEYVDEVVYESGDAASNGQTNSNGNTESGSGNVSGASNTGKTTSGTKSSKAVASAGFVDGGDIAKTADSLSNVQLTFWNGLTGPDGTTMQSIVNAFNNTYKGKINVKMQAMQWDVYYSKILTTYASSSSTKPHVGIIHSDQIARYAKKGILTELDSQIVKMGLKDSDFISDLWKSVTYNGKKYAIPLDAHSIGLYYNKKLLAEKGISVPKTGDEFIAACKALTDSSKNQWGTAIQPGLAASQLFFSIMNQYGGSATSSDGKVPLFNSDQGVKALQWMYDLVSKHKVSQEKLSGDSYLTLFKAGKSAFLFEGIWQLNSFKQASNLDFDVAPLPLVGSSNKVYFNSHNFVLFKQKTDDDKINQARLVFIDYISRHSIEWAKAGQIPARNSVRESSEFQQLTYQKVFATQLKDAVVPLPSPYIVDSFWTPAGKAIDKVFNSGVSVKKALDDAVAQGKQAVAQLD